MKRQIQQVLINRLKQWRCAALLGMRQVGKSYLLNEICREYPARLLSFDDPLERAEAARDPVRYLESRYHQGEYLFIDEAARVPEVFSAVKIIVDKLDPNPTGICLANSGNYLLLRKIKESLAGRVTLLPVYPFSWQEVCRCNGAPGLIQLLNGAVPEKLKLPASFISIQRAREERMLWGGLPMPCLSDDDNARRLWIRDYIRTYILPLVVEQFNIRDSLAFEQAARSLFLQNSSFINANKLARDIGVSQPTAMHYMRYLEAMMVAQCVPVFFRNPLKRLIKYPKVYIADTLLVNECLGWQLSIKQAAEAGKIGAIYEGFIFNEICKTLANYDIFSEVFSWRTRDKAEVDIILSGPRGLLPLEVKWSSRLTRKDTSGLISFMECYPDVKQGYIIYPGEDIQRITDTVTAVPDWWLLGCY